jgi:hypothetical protein
MDYRFRCCVTQEATTGPVALDSMLIDRARMVTQLLVRDITGAAKARSRWRDTYFSNDNREK